MLKIIILTLAVVSPLYSVYKWWTAVWKEDNGWGIILKTWKLCPCLSAVASNIPDGSKVIDTTGTPWWAMKWAITHLHVAEDNETSSDVTFCYKINVN